GAAARAGPAAGVPQAGNENMAGAARMPSIEGGRDVRRFAFVATGGAGPVHAWGVAGRLGIPRLVLPPSAGLASAFGMLTAPPAFDFARSLPSLLGGVEWQDVRGAIAEMRTLGLGQLALAGIHSADVTVGVSADVRYRGQGEGITVPLGPELTGRPAVQVYEAFEAAYARLYGRQPPGVVPEVLTWRVRVAGPRPIMRTGAAVQMAGPACKGRRPIWSEEKGSFVEGKVWDRYRLAPRDGVARAGGAEGRRAPALLG